MAYTLNFVLLITCFLLLYNTNGSPVEVKCPVYCDCDIFEGLKRGTCQNRKLVSVEIDMPPQVDVLDLSFNQISRLKNTIFVELGLLNLKLLNVSHNKISEIDIFAFEGLSELKTLDMSYNMLNYFLDPWFVSLDQLQELYLKGNLLKSINSEPKLNLINLQVLDISDCRIENLHPGVFEFVPNLEVLDISNNYLIHLKVDVIKPLTKLTILNAQDNNFKCKDHFLVQLRNYTAHHGITYDDSCKKKNSPNKQEKFQRMMVAPPVAKKNSWIYDENEEKSIIIVNVCNGTENEFLKNDTLLSYVRIPYLRDVIQLSPEVFVLITLMFGITVGIFLGCSCQLRHKYKEIPEQDEPYPLFMTAPYRKSISSISSRRLQRQVSAPSTFRTRTRSIGSRKFAREDRNILLMNEHKLSDSTPVLSRKSLLT